MPITKQEFDTITDDGLPEARALVLAFLSANPDKAFTEEEIDAAVSASARNERVAQQVREALSRLAVVGRIRAKRFGSTLYFANGSRVKS
jgi:hypothetical protein